MCDDFQHSLLFPLISLTFVLCNLMLGAASPAVYKQQGSMVTIYFFKS